METAREWQADMLPTTSASESLARCERELKETWVTDPPHTQCCATWLDQGSALQIQILLSLWVT